MTKEAEPTSPDVDNGDQPAGGCTVGCAATGAGTRVATTTTGAGAGGETLFTETVEDASGPPTVSDPAELVDVLQEGDILLMRSSGGVSDLITQPTGTEYSHAAIIARDDSGNLVLVDAPGPDRTPAIRQVSDIESMISGAAKDGVFRPSDQETAVAASRWALQQVGQEPWRYDIFDPYDANPKTTYCSDFVHQAFTSQGAVLVEDPIDLLDDEHEAGTLQALRDYSLKARFASDEKIIENVKAKGAAGEFIAPAQLGDSDAVEPVIFYEP